MSSSNSKKASQKMSKEKSGFDYFFLIYIVYLAVIYIPIFGSITIIGPQWLYVSVLNVLVLVLILFNKDRFGNSLSLVLQHKATILFLVFLLWASISMTYALNKEETLVCLARLLTHVIAFINIAVLAMGRLDHLKKVFALFSILLLGDSIYTLYSFFQSLPEATDLTALVVGKLAGFTGNKNILAASTLIKIPFCLYYIYISKAEGKILHGIALFVGLLALFIVNTRSTYVSLILIVIIYLVFCFINYLQKKEIKKLLWSSGYLLIPLIAGLITSQIILTNALDLIGQSNTNQTVYGTVGKRIESIGFSSEGSSGRTELWKAAIAFTKKHPIVGGGYGNWKVFSNQYTAEWLNDLNVPHHSHNDFIEAAAELGIIGGLLYLGIFICTALYILKIWRSNTNADIKTIATFLFMGLVGYMIDAALNFPGERSEIQLLLEFLIGFIVVISIMTKEAIQSTNPSKTNFFPWYAKAYISLMLLFSIPGIGINFLTFQSMKGQVFIMEEINKTSLMPLQKVQGFFADANTKIPNLTFTGDLAIDAVVSRYYIKEKKYDSALILLDRSKMANPYLYYNEFLKGLVYIQTNQIDSANKYCKLSFYNRPRDQSYFINMMVIAYKQKDTVELNKAFHLYTKYRDESYPYKIYLNAMVNLTSNNDQGLIKMADSAIKKFHADTVNLKDIIGYRNTLINRNNSIATKANSEIDAVNNEQSVADIEILAIAAYNKKDYTKAAPLFIKASELDSSNYTFYENAGLSYFNLKEYQKAILFFNKAMKSNKAINGKSEMFKGLALIVLGNKSGGCEWMHKAKEKKYPGSDTYIKNNCN